MSQDNTSVSGQHPERKPPRHTIVIAAAVVIIVASLGWFVLAGYVVTITGSARAMADIATATANLLGALPAVGRS